MRRLRPACALAMATLLAMAGVRAASMAGEIQVTPLVSGGQVSASFNATGALDGDTRELIGSGLLVTFTFVVDLRRASTIWFDHTFASAEVAASVKYDNLTGVYQVSRSVDGHVVRSERTREAADVKAWLTVFERVVLAPAAPLEPNGDYYVRVRLRTSPRRTFSLWPFGGDDGAGRAEFTFIR